MEEKQNFAIDKSNQWNNIDLTNTKKENFVTL